MLHTGHDHDQDEPPPFRWSAARVLLLACAYAGPFVLLCLKLRGEMQDGTLSLDGSTVLMRFVVVGLFALLLGRWCMHWMRAGRRPAR